MKRSGIITLVGGLVSMAGCEAVSSRQGACEVRDRDCVLATAMSVMRADYAKIENKMRLTIYDNARGVGFVMAETTPPEQLRYEKYLRELGTDDEYMEIVAASMNEKRLAANAEPEWTTLAAVEKALSTREAPNGQDVDDFVEKVYPAILAREPDAAVAFWEANINAFYKNAFGAFYDTFLWVAANNPPAFGRYIEKYRFPRNSIQNPWVGLSAIAASLCHEGKKEQGESILQAMQDEKAGWEADREMQAMDWAAMSEAVYSCRGLEAVQDMVVPVLAQMDLDSAAANEKYTSPDERKAVLDTILSETKNRLVAPVVRRLIEEGRMDEARAFYERAPFRQTVATAEDIANKGVLGLASEQRSFDEFVAMEREGDKDGSVNFYNSANPEAALQSFLKAYSPDFEQCCVIDTNLQEIMGRLSDQWPRKPSEEAAKKLLAISRQMREKDIYRGDETDDAAQLTVAILERKTNGCNVSDASLKAILASIDTYEQAHIKAANSALYLRYLAQPAATKSGDCLVK